MLEKQSLDEFLLNVSKGKSVVVSLSPQSRASLAVHFGLSPLEVICYTYKTMLIWYNFHNVGWMNCWFVHFGYMCLVIISAYQVFRKLTTLLKSLGVKAIFDTSSSRDLTLIESCEEFLTRYRQRESAEDEKSKSALPMISSACPGIQYILSL